MATLDLFTGFEHGSLNWFDSYNTFVEISSTTPRNGTYCLYMNGQASSATKLLPTPSSDFWVRFGIRTTTVQTGFYTFEGAIQHAGIRMNPTGSVWDLLTVNYTNAVASGGAWSGNTWYCVEVHFVIADSGSIDIYIDGAATPTVHYAGDTRNGGTGVVDRISFFNAPSSGPGPRYDDFALARDGRIGNGRAVDKAPSSAGDNTGLTIAGGDPANWQAVDNRPPDPSKYVYASTVDLYDLYALAASGLNSGAVVNAIQPYAIAMLNQAGAGNLAVGIKSGAVEDWSSDIVLPSDSWKFVSKVYTARPVGMGGGAWTQAVIDALQAGAKVR